jgi:hypothetical protein
MYYFAVSPPEFQKILLVLRDYSDRHRQTLAEHYLARYFHMVGAASGAIAGLVEPRPELWKPRTIPTQIGLAPVGNGGLGVSVPYGADGCLRERGASPARHGGGKHPADPRVRTEIVNGSPTYTVSGSPIARRSGYPIAPIERSSLTPVVSSQPALTPCERDDKNRSHDYLFRTGVPNRCTTGSTNGPSHLERGCAVEARSDEAE